MFRRFWRHFEYSIHSFMHVVAVLYGFSISLMVTGVYLWLYLLCGLFLFRFNFLALLLGFAIPSIFPKVKSILLEAEGLHFYGMLIGFNVLLFCLFWLLFRQKNFQHDHSSQDFVFWDPSGFRWSLWKRTTAILLFMIGLVMFTLATHLFPQILSFEKKEESASIPILVNSKGAVALSRPSDTEMLYAFYNPDDPESKRSFEEHASSIQVLLPEWYRFSPDGTIQEKAQPDILKITARHNMTVLPVLQEPEKGWENTDLLYMLKDDHSRSRLALSVLVEVMKNQSKGIVLNFPTFPSEEQKSLQLFLQDLRNLFNPYRLEIAAVINSDQNQLDIKAMDVYTNQFIVVSSSGQFEKLRALNIPQSKLILTLNNYGKENDGYVSFADVMNQAAATISSINWSKEGRPVLNYSEGKDMQSLPFFDAASLYNDIHDSTAFKPRAYALYRLGLEDPSSWNVLEHFYHGKKLNLTEIVPPQSIRFLGSGEMLQVETKGQQGKRDITLNEAGQIISEDYLQIPLSFEMKRMGELKEKAVILTFHNSPDSRYTEKILNILSRYKIQAVFFVTGDNIIQNQDDIKEIVANEHEIGFRTSYAKETSAKLKQVEMKANERALQGIAGYESMLLYEPTSLKEQSVYEFLRLTSGSGYLIMEGKGDAELKASPEELVKFTLQKLKDSPIITLPDGEEQTVQALPGIIEALQRQGYRFMTVHDLLQIPQEQVLSATSYQDDWVNDQLAFLAAPIVQKFFAVSFYVVIILGTMRMIMLCWFAYRQRKQPQDEPMKEFPFISIILAAYNEEKVIAKTLQSISKNSYPNFEVIVVNDGSTDRTSEEVEKIQEKDARIRLINQDNQGKSVAVNRAFREAKGEVVISIDADTQMLPDAIERLIQPFSDPSVGAVSGNVKVGNMKNRLTKWQHIEYVTSFNLDRRAFSFLHSVPVVPGALGAWRKSAIEKIGYFPHDTLAEDTDVTVTLLKEGYRVLYREHALAYTEAPDDLKNFLKQRFRWVFGILQCLWKHKEALFSRRFVKAGFIVFPYMWIFQFLFQLLVPIADLYSIYCLFSGQAKQILYFYISFLIMDWVTCWFAFRLEKENTKPLWGFFLQRFFYRYLLAFTVYRAFFQAVRGKRMGWNKVQRTDSVQVPQ